MRTEPPSPLASTFARLRNPAGRARRWLAARGAPARVALVLAALAVVGGPAYLATLDDPADRAWAWLYEGRRLSADDLSKLGDALDLDGFVHVADLANGRVGVRPEARSQALAALAKRKVAPLTLEMLGGPDEAPGLLDGPEERERRERARLEASLKVQIEGLDPAITSAHVRITRTRGRGLSAPPRVSAYVYLQTEGRRTLNDRVVAGIETFLAGYVADLKPEAITVADQAGRKYLAAGNPSLRENMQAHAQEEDWRDRIAEGLRHIPGVGVSVLLETVAVPPPAPEPMPAAAVEVVRPNGPVAADPDPPPAPAVPPPAPSPIKARVWVRIPRSFYQLAIQHQWPGRAPAPEEVKALEETTERLARSAVANTIPGEILGQVTIDRVQDDLSNPRAFPIPPAPESRRAWAEPAAYGGLAGVAALGLAAMTFRLAGRRPSTRPAPAASAWRPGFVADGPSGPVPGPSERVRELIRTGPDAAAGVLQRWIGQGGTPG